MADAGVIGPAMADLRGFEVLAAEFNPQARL